MLHNPSYDFNDDLIPLGGSLWVRLAEAWLARQGAAAMSTPPGTSRRPTPRRATSSSPRHAARGLGVESHVHPLTGRDGEMLAMDVARDGPRRARSLLVVSSACHGVEGFCGSGVQVALLEDADWHRAAHDAGVAVLYVHAPQPLGLLLVAAHDPRERRPEPQLPRLRRRRAAQRRLRRARPLIVPATWPPDAATVDATARFVAEHGAKAWQAAISGGQYHHPDGLFYGGDAPTWSQRRCATCCATTARAAAGSPGSTCTPASARAAHGERIFAGRDDAAAYARAKAWWGDGHLDLRRLARPRPCSPA